MSQETGSQRKEYQVPGSRRELAINEHQREVEPASSICSCVLTLCSMFR